MTPHLVSETITVSLEFAGLVDVHSASMTADEPNSLQILVTVRACPP